MTRFKPSNASSSVIALAGLFLLALTLATASLLWNAKRVDLAESEAKAALFVNGAEAALNRSLLGVDVVLASMDELLELSHLVADWINIQAANRLMHGAVQQNLMIQHAALINSQGDVMASSDASGAALVLSLPPGFVQDALAQPISTLRASAPVVSFASSERVIYFARSIALADSSKVLAVAEIPVSILTSIMIQGVNIMGLEVTLERGNGQLLASVPALEQLLGRQLSPALGEQVDAERALGWPARISGTPAMVMSRPLLYRDLLISASIPIEAALADWRTQRNFIVAAALLFAFMIVAAAGSAIWYLARLRQARLTIVQAKSTLDQALESMVSGFMLLDAKRQVVRWNRRFEEIFPWLTGTITPTMPFRQVLELTAKHHQPGASEAELQDWVERRLALQADQQAPHEQTLPDDRSVQITERSTPDGGMVIIYHDITELRQSANEIKQLAFYDSLTALPNRRLLMDRLQQAITSNARSALCGALLFLDLDRFKTLNDTLGHNVGDLLLQQVAQRLKVCVREEDTVARLGGDEFVVMLEDLSKQSEEAAAMARQIGGKILERLNLPYQLETHSYRITPSIGATLFGVAPLSAADLLAQADIAMYEVKSRGRNALCFFDPQMQVAINARAELEQDLQAALQEDQFALYYQPQVELEGRVIGAEVLIRWHHPLRGLVLPLEFIAVAEESELILPIGKWVFRTACQQLATWQNIAACNALHLSVNVSARQFHHADFVAEVATVLQESGASAHLLKLELTESMMLVNVDDTIAKMSELKAMGVQFSVDDFGTGFSSLAYLSRLPLNELKIDQSFVRSIGINDNDDVIVQTIIGMARSLGLEVIAEGVETQAQQEFLALHGCTLFQGYRFGKPTPLADFEALLA